MINRPNITAYKVPKSMTYLPLNSTLKDLKMHKEQYKKLQAFKERQLRQKMSYATMESTKGRDLIVKKKVNNNASK